MSQMMTRKIWEYNRLAALAFGPNHFVGIITAYNTLNCAINSLRIRSGAISICENEPRHAVDFNLVIPSFFLLFQFHLKRIVNDVKHWDNSDACLSLRL